MSTELRAVREERGLTATAAAAAIGISANYLMQIESGRRPLSGSVLVAAAQVYGMTVDALQRAIGWTPRPRKPYVKRGKDAA